MLSCNQKIKSVKNEWFENLFTCCMSAASRLYSTLTPLPTVSTGYLRSKSSTFHHLSVCHMLSFTQNCNAVESSYFTGRLLFTQVNGEVMLR